MSQVAALVLTKSRLETVPGSLSISRAVGREWGWLHALPAGDLLGLFMGLWTLKSVGLSPWK